MPSIFARLGSLLLLLFGVQAEATYAKIPSHGDLRSPNTPSIHAGLPESLLPMPSISPISSDPSYEPGLPERAIEENIEEEDFKDCQVDTLSDLSFAARILFSAASTGCPSRSPLVELRSTCLRC